MPVKRRVFVDHFWRTHIYRMFAFSNSNIKNQTLGKKNDCYNIKDKKNLIEGLLLYKTFNIENYDTLRKTHLIIVIV